MIGKLGERVLKSSPVSKQRHIELEIMEKGGRRRLVSEEGEEERDEMQGTQAASIIWFGAEAICTYCSP